ncbi:ASPIC/UnbV domain-containing protein [Rhodopirellula sp. P2]|uniref:ASPIC/UnbV domain-containing protein n=1 Tax=Rhodopirellula sp. P2 TaxID=2127060 RepID=UPI00236763F0|nr:ASPIC/UnbV domain-containing protein [Rhodopirellula sp. P2]WDQ15173.1 ASPIC/UnbV domain-containing protein [Rhodopirellula sp. P2]
MRRSRFQRTTQSHTQTQWLLAGEGYMCSSERTIVFGVGKVASDSPIEATITWPNGSQQTVQTSPDQDVIVIQGQPTAFTLAPVSLDPIR